MVVVFSSMHSSAQQIPSGSCGIVNVYDANGARTKRVYFCNNGGTYPARLAQKDSSLALQNETVAFVAVDALFPNPTTGRFTITFGAPLDGATVYITDANGKMLQRIRASGTLAEFDLSGCAAGVYFVRIKQGEIVITKKVVKQ